MRHRQTTRSTDAISAAQRLMNLIFMVSVSPVPPTTEEIIADSDLGYGSENPESDKKKFQRDRANLRERGIIIREIKPDGSLQTDSSTWMLDREATHAQMGVILPEDIALLEDALELYQRRSDIPYSQTLDRLRIKLAAAQSGRVDLGHKHLDTNKQNETDAGVREAVWAALCMQKRLPFSYQDALGRKTDRTVAVYGITMQDGHCYFVGADDENNIRTFRTDRVLSVRAPQKHYEIPNDFTAADYLFLPFDFPAEQPAEVVFSFPRGTGKQELEALIQGRGILTSTDEEWLWKTEVQNLTAAAAFALSHASSLGMRPVSPPQLQQAWSEHLRKVVEAHVS
ncbi:WYL domain-containing protein [Collinsella sp. AGMB00827]|uniref:WYL domain-containing protein n=1 Tax=Collinsella ureilytica TaxID=2869515 RepID=A0ABS7ML45_9ACTN|nr:WYL domain-containing protein [Collinsella urealyticum]MBY4797815.1 WYL domain-containing protein [Collinsella urealyticum]